MRDDVVPQILGMQPHRLRNRADLAAQLLQVQVPQIASVVIDCAGGWRVDAKRKPEQGALAGAGLPGNGDEFAGTGPDRDIVEYQRAVGIVAEGNTVEQDLAAQTFNRLSPGRGLGNRGQQRTHLVKRRHHGGNGAERLAEPGDRVLESDEDSVNDEKVADRNVPVAHCDYRKKQYPAGKQGQRGAEGS